MAREYVDLDDLNAQAEAWCEGLAMDRRWPDDHARRVREVFEEERPGLLPLPEVPFPCEERAGASASKTPYVRFDLNDDSVPHTHLQQELEVLASTERVRIVRGTKVLAEHARSYDRGLRIEDPSHLEALVEERTAARQHRATERATRAGRWAMVRADRDPLHERAQAHGLHGLCARWGELGDEPWVARRGERSGPPRELAGEVALARFHRGRTR